MPGVFGAKRSNEVRRVAANTRLPLPTCDISTFYTEHRKHQASYSILCSSVHEWLSSTPKIRMDACVVKDPKPGGFEDEKINFWTIQ